MIPDELKPYCVHAPACPLCNSRDFRPVISVDGLEIQECRSCRFRFMNPYLSSEGMGLLYQNSEILASLNPALERYYEYEAGKQNSRTRADYLNVLRYAEANIPVVGQKRRVFEVGYGKGAFLLEAARRGWEVDGVDTGRENYEFLKNKHHLHLQCGTFDGFQQAAKRYHLVALWDVIEHTITPRSFVRKARQMLVPGGLLVLATPNIAGLLNQVSEFLYFSTLRRIRFAAARLYVFEHVGYYAPETLRKLAHDQGFSIAKEILTETDLNRYTFSTPLRFALRFLFFLARIARRQNRIILIAEKGPHES